MEENTSAGFPALLTSADQRVVRNARRELLSLDEDAKKEVQPKIKDEKEEEEEEEELLMMMRISAKYKKNFCRVSGSADIGRSKGCQKCSSRFLS